MDEISTETGNVDKDLEFSVFCDLFGLLADILLFGYPTYSTLQVLAQPNETITIRLLVYWLVTAFFLLYEKYMWVFYHIGLQALRRVVCAWFMLPVAYNDFLNVVLPMVPVFINNMMSQAYSAVSRNVWSLSATLLNEQRLNGDHIAAVQQNLFNFRHRRSREQSSQQNNPRPPPRRSPHANNNSNNQPPPTATVRSLRGTEVQLSPNDFVGQ